MAMASPSPWIMQKVWLTKQQVLALFSFLYLKKQNFKNICRIGKFSKMGACRPPNGRQGACRPSSGRQDLNVKKILHLGPGAQGALNSELVKSI